MKVSVDRDLCSGAGNCVVLAPGVFRLDEKKKAVVAPAFRADDQTLWDAAEGCPENAIILLDDEGNQVYP